MATTTTTSRPLTPDGAVDIGKEEQTTAVGSEDLNQRQNPLPSTTKVILLASCLTFANIVYSFGGTGVTVLLDDIAADLHVAENNLQWIFNSVQLSFVSVVSWNLTKAETHSRVGPSIPGMLHLGGGERSRHLGTQAAFQHRDRDGRSLDAHRRVHEESNCVLRVPCDQRTSQCLGSQQ